MGGRGVVWRCQSDWLIFFQKIFHLYLVGLNEELIQENPMDYIMHGAGVNYYSIGILASV